MFVSPVGVNVHQQAAFLVTLLPRVKTVFCLDVDLKCSFRGFQ